VLTDRGTEYCGDPEYHDYEFYLAVEDIDHTQTKTKSPQTNGICERFHRTVQTDLDLWIREYNEVRPHQGHWCFGKTLMQTLIDALPMAREKMIAA
jgi:transposase InsO family protein